MPPTGLDEGTLRALAANCGHAYLTGARATGRPWIEDEDPVMSDLGLPIPLSANNATLLRPPSGPNDGAGVASRTARSFTGPGGGYQVWSLWPVDLEPFRFSRSTSPCMVREPGGERRPPPPELDVMEVGDDAGMREIWAIVDEVFGRGRAPSPSGTPACRLRQVQPLKWQVLDYNGNPISDPSFFEGVDTSLGAGACASGVDDPIETYVGDSGLQYLGDGFWAYNWKTSGSLAGKCRVVGLEFAFDQYFGEATFQFK